MSKDEALELVVKLKPDERIVLLGMLMQEMNSDDADEVLSENGYEPV